uniref:hypothetical protein n=1 Tax=Pseudomonas aeruginosa TaxID=287 RepID=UPI001CC197D4
MSFQYMSGSKRYSFSYQEALEEYWVIGFTCCFRQSAGLKHIGISFGFECCYNERSPIAGD